MEQDNQPEKKRGRGRPFGSTKKNKENIVSSEDNSEDLSKIGKKAFSQLDNSIPVDEIAEAVEENSHEAFRKNMEESIEGDSNIEDASNVEGLIGDNSHEDINKIPEDDSNPLDEDVIINDYKNTSQPIANPNIPPQQERFIPEPVVVDLPILEKKEEDKKTGEQGSEKEKKEKKPANPDFEDISPSQRRKNAEKDADALITTWSQILPVIPKKLASYNIPKMELMEMKGELNLNIQILEDGTTIRSYAEENNKKVEEVFVYTQEMKDAVKEPLVEVLLEKGFAMTPTQRLIKVVAEQALQFGVAAFQMRMDNNNAIAQFKAFHEESKNKPSGYTSQNNNVDDNIPQPEKPTPPVNSTPNNFKEETISFEEVIDNKEGNSEVSFEDVIEDGEGIEVEEENND